MRAVFERGYLVVAVASEVDWRGPFAGRTRLSLQRAVSESLAVVWFRHDLHAHRAKIRPSRRAWADPMSTGI